MWAQVANFHWDKVRFTNLLRAVLIICLWHFFFKKRVFYPPARTPREGAAFTEMKLRECILLKHDMLILARI